MTPDLVFTIANNGILVFWLALIAAPNWKGTEYAVHSIALPVVLGLTYIWLLTTGFLAAPPDAGFFSLHGVMAFFSSPALATAGWVHYLVFDLFIGAWQVRDARRRGLPHWAVVPSLIVTLMAGPAGLLCYLGLRLALGKGGTMLAEG